MKIELSELYTSLPPPEILRQLVQEYPNSLIAFRHHMVAIVLDFPPFHYAKILKQTIYPVPYYGDHLLASIVPHYWFADNVQRDKIYHALGRSHPSAFILWEN